MRSGESYMSDTKTNHKPDGLLVTASGAIVDLDDIAAADIQMYDISYGLRHCNRWSGQLGAMSVAEHSALVTTMLDQIIQPTHEGKRDLLRYALMHDASEAYLGELPAAVKRRVPDYVELEDNLMRRIAAVIGFAAPTTLADIHDFHAADTMASVVEMCRAGKIKPTDTPAFALTKEGDKMLVRKKQRGDRVYIELSYNARVARAPLGRVGAADLPTWEMWLIDLFGYFGDV